MKSLCAYLCRAKDVDRPDLFQRGFNQFVIRTFNNQIAAPESNARAEILDD